MTDDDLLNDTWDEDEGTLLAGGAPPPPTLGWGRLWYGDGLVPPFPGPDVVPLVAPPAPPLLRPTDPEGARVAQVLAAYVNVHRWVTPRVLRVKHPRSEVREGTAAWARAVAMCAALDREGMPPAMWCRFAITTALERDDAVGVVPWRWVLDPDGVARKAGWFRRESATYGVGTVRMTPAHRVLIAAHNRLTATLVREGSHNPAEIRATVERFFPAGAWEKMVASARAEAVRLQSELNRRVAEGEVQWR